MRWGRWRAALVVGAMAGTATLAGCGGGAPAGSTGSAHTVSAQTGSAPAGGVMAGGTVSPGPSASAAATGPATSPAGPAAPGSAGGSVVVPVAVGPVTGTGTAMDGAMIATVQVTVGGGQPVTVRLDTGSAGLLLDKSVAGPATTDTGEPMTTEFGGSTASGTLGQAQVSMGEATTPGPIGITLVDTSKGVPPTFAGTHGLLGVGTTDSPTAVSTQVWAPTLQLPSPADQGVLLDLTTAGGTGTMTLGPVTVPAGGTALPLARLTGSPSSYPGGAPGWSRLAQVCWTVGGAPSDCAPTDFDTGNPVLALSATTFSALGPMDSFLPAGQPVTLTTPDGPTLLSTTSAEPQAPEALLLTGLGAATYNTGIGLFQHAVVGVDYVAGRIVVAPRP